MRVCSLCQEPGHRRETCPTTREPGTGRFRATSGPEYNKAIDEDTVKEICRLKVEEDMPPREIADTTGVAYATVLRYLSKNGISHKVIVRKKTPPIDEYQFLAVRGLRWLDNTSADVAERLHLSLEEVNAAWAATSYDYYLRNR